MQTVMMILLMTRLLEESHSDSEWETLSFHSCDFTESSEWTGELILFQ